MKSKGVFLNIVSNNRNDISERINFLNKLDGLQHVEIWMESADWTDQDAKWLAGELKGLDIIVHAPFISFSLVSDYDLINNASLQALKKAADLTAVMQGKLMTIHVGRRPLYMDVAQARTKAVPYLKELYNYVADRFILAIENLPQSGGTNPRYPVELDELDQLSALVPGLKYTIDIGHCFQNKEEYHDFFRQSVDKIANLHVHNAFSGGQAHFGFQKPGDLDLSEFKNFLAEIGYAGYFTLEILDDIDITKSWEMLNK